MKECLPCTVDITLKVIGGKWKPVILWHLRDQAMRFNQLHRQIEGITQKMLTQQLREMEADGLVSRTIYPEIPPRVEYAMTAHGNSLRPLLQAMSEWGSQHQKRTGS